MIKKLITAIRKVKHERTKRKIKKILMRSVRALYWVEIFLDSQGVTRVAKREFWRRFSSSSSPAQYIDFFLNGQHK